MKLIGLIENFALGGLVTVITSYIGTYFSPLAAAIFWAYPFTLLPTIFYMRKNGKDNEFISKFLLKTTFALIILFFVTIGLSRLFLHLGDNITLILLCSLGIWFILGLIYYYLINILGFKKYF